MAKPCSVEKVSRTVIENKLLVTLLEDKDRVAILATEEDLDLLLEALDYYKGYYREKTEEFAADIRQLKKGAFGK